MNQLKIGRFIAELRKKEGLTQEILGEHIGVSNKTISRWENGNYLPDIEMLPIIANEFNISVDDLLAGRITATNQTCSTAENSANNNTKKTSFSVEEKKNYYKLKWRKEHTALIVLFIIILVSSILLPFLINKPVLIADSPLIALVEYGFLNNTMMKYVEHSIYD